MLIARKYRLYPNPEQEQLLRRHFGCVRFVYNALLETKLRVYGESGKSLSRFELQVVIREMKAEYPWLKEVNSQSLQGCALRLTSAFTNFCEGRAGMARFKSLRGRQAFHCPQSVSVLDGKLFIPKFRSGIEVKVHRPLGGTIRNATVSRDPSGKYYVSITVETGKAAPEPKEVKRATAVGIDLGLKSFMVCSDGKHFDNPRHLDKSLGRLQVLQRRASHKKKGSRNRAKAMRKVAVLHEKTRNQRKDFLHKASSEIAGHYETVCVEDLNIAGMMKNHHLARAIGSVGWGMFVTFLKYKVAFRGGHVLECGRFDPTSKRHSGCGYLYQELTLDQRQWLCQGCGAMVDRDENAALNILYYALIRYFSNDCVEPDRCVPASCLAKAEAKKQKDSGSGLRPSLEATFYEGGRSHT